MRSQQIECSLIEMKNNKIQNQKLEGRFSLRLKSPSAQTFCRIKNNERNDDPINRGCTHSILSKPRNSRAKSNSQFRIMRSQQQFYRNEKIKRKQKNTEPVTGVDTFVMSHNLNRKNKLSLDVRSE